MSYGDVRHDSPAINLPSDELAVDPGANEFSANSVLVSLQQSKLYWLSMTDESGEIRNCFFNRKIDIVGIQCFDIFDFIFSSLYIS
uniref:Uncharacterized protein n=1 Tax=Romanomermis culicivorax TaxID=13658 RepID=A0A915JQA2_ROMCU